MIVEEKVRTEEVGIEKIKRKSSGEEIFFLEEEIYNEVLFYDGDLSDYGLSVDVSKEVVYTSENRKVCDECLNTPLFDDNNDEYYCPVCQ